MSSPNIIRISEPGSGAIADSKDKSGTDYFEVIKDIAYRGRIGLQRKKFCIDYIEKKKKNLLLIKKEQLRKAEEAGKVISCRKGCRYCCSAYVEASIQECEAIVYYLYENNEALKIFLKNYPRWREEIRRNGDLFKQCSLRWKMDVEPQDKQSMEQRFDRENRKYYRQDIACPFLDNDLCMIYKTRPYMCATLVSFSPNDWCKPDSRNKPEILMAYPSEIFFDRSFYYGKFSSRVLSFMPLTVYEILKNGTYYLSRVVPELENLDKEFRTDPDVSSILKRIK